MLFSKGLSEKYIQNALGSTYKIRVKKCVTSTNAILKDEAGKGAEEFSVLIASKQTAGRGRRGRSFYSPADTGVYMSILLKPGANTDPLLITTDMGVCCARVFERMSHNTSGIKWVNDIYIKGKKVCGILAEKNDDSVIVGVGINVFPPKTGFPDEIKDRAGSVFEKKQPLLKERVVIELLKEFLDIYKKADRNELLEEYRKRSLVIGKKILILSNDENQEATALEISEDYSLVVRKNNGEVCNINSGDVSIKI